MHYWLHGIGLVEGYDQLPEVTLEMVVAAFSALGRWIEEKGFTLDKMCLPTRSDSAAAVSITNLMSPHRARDMDMLAKAISKIDVNDPRLADYDTWCAVFRAMWAACGGDRQFYSDHILPWLEKNPANAKEDMEVKLASFTDSQLGAEYVYRWAAAFGFTEAINQHTMAKVQELFDSIEEPTADGGADRAAVGPGQIPLVQPGGVVSAGVVDLSPQTTRTGRSPTPSSPPTGARWRYNVDAKRWFTFDGMIWNPSDAILEVLGSMMAEQAAIILQTVNGPQRSPPPTLSRPGFAWAGSSG